MVSDKDSKNVDLVEEEVPFKNKIVKLFIFIFVALIVFSVTFFVELSLSGPVAVKTNNFDKFDYSVENKVFDFGFFRFGDSSVTGIKNNFKLLKNIGDDYIFEMFSGKVWGNLKFVNKNVNIIVNRLVLIPDHATFSLTYSDSKILIKVLEGDVVLGILPEDVGIISYTDEYNDLYVNTMVLPRLSEVSIPLSKLDSRVDTLFLSKLVKEFGFGAIPRSFFNPEVLIDEEKKKANPEAVWILKNLDLDNIYFSNLKRNFISKIISFDYKNTVLSDFIDSLEDRFVFVDSKIKSISDKRFVDNFYNILNYAHNLDFSKVSNELELKKKISSIDIKNDNFYSFFDSLQIFNTDDPEYHVYIELVNKIFDANSESSLLLLNDLWFDIYDAVSKGSVYAYDSFDTFVSYFNKYNFSLYPENFRRKYYTYLNNKLFVLFRVNPEFFKKNAFKFKNEIEKLILSLYVDGSEKTEIIQTLIQNKIFLLTQLKKYYFSGELTLENALPSYELLIADIKKLMASIKIEPETLKFFNIKLDKLSGLYGYMKSPEYNSSTSHGITHEDRYKNYLLEEDALINFITVTEDINGDVVSEISIDDVIAEVKNEFSGIDGLSSISIGDVTDVTQRNVDVSGSVLKYPFSAKYDRGTGLLSDVYSYDKLVSEKPISVKNLPVVLSQKLTNDAVNDENSNDSLNESVVIESSVQKLAKAYILGLIKDVGIAASNDDIAFVGGVPPTYRITSVRRLIDDGVDDGVVEISFDFVVTGEVVKNVIVYVDGQQVVLDDEYKISDLPDLMVNTYSFSDDIDSDNIDVDNASLDSDVDVLKVSEESS